MSQHDMNIANQGFPAFRADLNNALGALATTSAGATEPSTTFANQFWYDSTDNLLKMRNSDNDAWITLAYLDQTNDEWEVRSAVIQAVDSAGVVIKTDDGTTRIEVQDDGDVAIDTDTLFVDATNDKIGINTSTPNSNLSLGDSTVDSDNFITFGKRVTSSQSNLPLIGHTSHDGSASDLGLCATSSGGNIIFYTGNNASGFGTGSNTERMRIASDGDVYMNTTSNPDVKNESCVTFEPDIGRVHINANSTVVPLELNQSAPDTVTRTILRFHRSEAAVGSVTASTTGVNYNESSDYRLKENITPITDAVERLKQLKPSRFNFIVEPDRTVDGFIAHEVQEVVPQAVMGEKDEVETVDVYDEEGNVTGQQEKPVYQGLDQSKLIPILTGALQEAIAKIEALEARVTALES